MPIISARDNKNERWKKKGKRKRQKRNKGVTQAMVEVWELNDFFGRLS